jgi:hypothetical protein
MVEVLEESVTLFPVVRLLQLVPLTYLLEIE